MVNERIEQDARDADAIMKHLTVIYFANQTLAPLTDQLQTDLAKAKVEDMCKFVSLAKNQLVLSPLLRECDKSGILREDCTVSFTFP